MDIHTFGDSHSYFGWVLIPGVTIHHVGPVLCHSFGEGKLSRLRITDHIIKDGDMVIFCFGEIDCRLHVRKYVTGSTTHESVINSLVENYFVAIDLNVKLAKDLKPIVFNVVPPSAIHARGSTTLGTDEERKKYVIHFNNVARAKCKDYGYTFFDVYDKYSDPNGFLIREYSDADVHIENPIFMKEFLDSITK